MRICGTVGDDEGAAVFVGAIVALGRGVIVGTGTGVGVGTIKAVNCAQEVCNRVEAKTKMIFARRFFFI